ncbi:MAG: DUF192 domain-containing protein [Dehalococcoidia bacterium]|nr:DUF192 domain-containing protein [Dehalococcoidia bacterium]
MRTGRWVAEDVQIAGSFFSKGKGLLGRKSIPDGYGLLIRQCNSIHSFFMAFPFDALFLDKRNTVIHIIRAMPANRISPILRSAHSVLELRAGKLDETMTGVGDIIEFVDT